MAINTQTINLDLSTGKVTPVVYAHQKDSNRQITIALKNCGVAYTPPSGTTCKVAYKSPKFNGGYTTITGNSMPTATISGSTITFDIPDAFLAVSGLGLMTLILTSSSTTIRPCNIALMVQESADGDDVVAGSSDFPPTLEALVASWIQANGAEMVDDWLTENGDSSMNAAVASWMQNNGATPIGNSVDDWLDDNGANLVETYVSPYIVVGAELNAGNGVVTFKNGDNSTAFTLDISDLTPQVDATLSQENVPAEAKATGTRLKLLDGLVIGQEGSAITSMSWSNNMPSTSSGVGYSDTGANYQNRPISSLFGAEYQAIVKSIDKNYPFVVVLYNGTEKVGLVEADGTIVSTVSDLLDYYDTQSKLIPYGYNAKIVIKGGAAADALSRVQVLNVSMGSAANAELLVSDIEKLNDEVFGSVGEEYDGTVNYTIGSPARIGLTDISSSDTGRLYTGFVQGKVRVKSNNANALFAIRIYDLNGNAEGILKSDGTIENVTTINANYYFYELVIPDQKQGRILVKKATNGSFSTNEVETYSGYIDINYLTESLADKVTTAAVVGAAYPHLYKKKIAALGDSLLEWSNKWVMQSANRYQMESYIRGVGSQYWFCTTERPNGAVYQVDTLVASSFVPDIVILEYGTNDVRTASGSFGTYATQASQSATTSVGAMRYCIETLQEEYPDCKILVLLPMMRNNNGLEPTAQTTFRALAKQVLADYSVQWVDMYETSGIVYDMMNPDGIHLMKTSGNYRVEGTGLYKYADRVERALVGL